MALAIVKFQQALAIDPNFVPAYTELAGAFRFSGIAGFIDRSEGMAKAHEALDAAENIDPNSAAVFARRGSLYRWENEALLAVEWLTKAKRLEPNNVGTRSLLSFVAMAAGEYPLAITEAKAALRLDPNSSDWVYITLGQALLMSGDLESAWVQLQQVLDAGTSLYNEAWARRSNVHILVGQGRFDEAREEVGKLMAAYRWSVLTTSACWPLTLTGSWSMAGMQTSARWGCRRSDCRSPPLRGGNLSDEFPPSLAGEG